jgi:hypothetical protein
VPKREVKEEYQTPAPQRRRASGGGISIREPVPQQRATHGSAALLVPKPEVKEVEDEMTTPTTRLDSTWRSWRRLTTTPHGRASWRTLSPRPSANSGRPLMDLTRSDDEAGPNGFE